MTVHSIIQVRVHFLLRSISPSQIHLNYSVIVPCFSSPSQKENLLNAFSNQNVGKYSTFSNGNTFSAPSQMEYMFYISRNLLRFFSMEIPSQLLLKWSTCSTSVLMISYEIDHVLLEYHQSPKTAIVLISPPIYLHFVWYELAFLQAQNQQPVH